MQELTLLPGQVLLQQDGQPRHAYVIKKGIAKCYITEENGKDYILEFFGEGEIIGELELLRQTTNLSSVQAVTGLLLYKVEGSIFRQLLEKDVHFNHIILKELATRVSQLAIRVSYQQLYPLEYTLLKLLSLFAHQDIPFSKQDLADYLAITVRSLNRTLKQLREKSFVQADGFDLHLTKPELDHLLRQFEDQ